MMQRSIDAGTVFSQPIVSTYALVYTVGNAYWGDNLPFIGEDNFFVHRLRKHGFRLLVNTDVQCLHMDLASGKYTAHPSVDLKKYYTLIPVTTPLTMEDKAEIDKRWVDRLPKSRGDD